MVTKHEQDCQERFKKVCPLPKTFEGQRECVQKQLDNKQQYTKVLHKCYNQYLSLTSKAYQEARTSERKTSPTPLFTPQVHESFDCQAEKTRLQQLKIQLEQDLQAINQQTTEVPKKCLLIENEQKLAKEEEREQKILQDERKRVEELKRRVTEEKRVEEEGKKYREQVEQAPYIKMFKEYGGFHLTDYSAFDPDKSLILRVNPESEGSNYQRLEIVEIPSWKIDSKDKEAFAGSVDYQIARGVGITQSIKRDKSPIHYLLEVNPDINIETRVIYQPWDKNVGYYKLTLKKKEVKKAPLVFDQPSPDQARAKYEQDNYRYFSAALGQMEADIIGGKHLPTQRQWVEQQLAEANLINRINSSLLSDDSRKQFKSKMIELLSLSEQLDQDYQKSMAESEKAVKTYKAAEAEKTTRILEPIEAAEIKIKKHRKTTAKQIAAQAKSKEYIQKAKNYIDNWERNHGGRKWKDAAKLNLFQVAKLMQKYYDVYDPQHNSFLTESLTQYGDYQDAYTDLIEHRRDRKLSKKMMDRQREEIMKGPSRKQLQEDRTQKILEKHLERPIDEQIWDEEEEASKIFSTVTKEAHDRWMKNPITYDIEGIDVHLSETDKLKREGQRETKKEKQAMEIKHASSFPWVIVDRESDNVLASYPTQKEAQGEFEKLSSQTWKHSGELELIFNG